MISIGLDLGKARDFTAIAIVSRTESTTHHVCLNGLRLNSETEYSPAISSTSKLSPPAPASPLPSSA
jgi:phage terminase large subunit-like protein